MPPLVVRNQLLSRTNMNIPEPQTNPAPVQRDDPSVTFSDPKKKSSGKTLKFDLTPVRFARKFKNLYRWRGHRGEERRRKEGKKEEGGEKKRKESEQDGGVREHGRMSGIVIMLRRIETKWR
ncbi:hypothetical protein TNCV_3882461 [Trichonephila clavipes]|nr:hypothetical protein TNCV_3882461 [Trichonephila clavipes]